MTQSNNNSTALFRTLAALQWLALPIMALNFATVWQQLPARMATHFDLANRPNGWMSREEALVIALGVSTAVLITATWITSRIKKPDATAWGLVGLFYVIQCTLIYAEQSMIDYNLYAKPIRVGAVLVTGIVAALLLVILSLSTQRGAHLPASRVYATETHASAFWALIMGAPVVFMITIVAAAPVLALKIALGLAALIGLWAASMAAFGFQYVFSSAGVDIRTLGFRLRSIAASEIGGYSVDDWPFWGGRGIRGLGNQRAYVWCDSGVRIRTATGEVFLGHKEPQRILRDLDKVVHSRKASEGA